MSYAEPVYLPAMRIITSITRAYPAVVTTGLITYPAGIETITPFINQYLSGTIIRLVIPLSYGMSQLHLKASSITVINGSSFEIDIDTTAFDAFVIPAPILTKGGDLALENYAQAVPFAEDSDMLTAAVQNILVRAP